MYYPEQRFTATSMQFKRQVRLPDSALGSLQVDTGQRVEVRDVVARGLIPSKHVILDAMAELHVSNPDDVEKLLLVSRRTRVQEGQPIAGKDANRGRRVLAPFDGIVITVDKGRIIFQAMPEIVNLEAGVRGRVTQVEEGRSVEIEAVGGVVQGVWGNGRNIIAIVRVEPERGGLLSIPRETLDSTYRGEILVTRHPLTREALALAEIRSFAGIIAPSMSATLADEVRSAPFAVMLTVGFGAYNMTPKVFTLFQEYADTQIALDAAEPRRFDPRRPEAVFSRTSNETLPTTPDFIALEVGSEVRLTRDPYFGRIGKVVGLPHQAVELENGLRVKCARVLFSGGQRVDVPLANLEVAGV